MAHNNIGKIWWSIEGGAGPINRLTIALQKNRHYVVQDGKTHIYLQIQNSETKFVESVVTRYNVRAKQGTPPEYETAPCGKFSTNVGRHAAHCNGCIRIKSNQAAQSLTEAARVAEIRAKEAAQAVTLAKEARGKATADNLAAIADEPANPSTESPDKKFGSGVGSSFPSTPVTPPPPRSSQVLAEHRENQAKNGPVITIKGPSQTSPEDYQGRAVEFRRVANELLEQATHYSTLAEKIEALLAPTDAVKEAEKALAEARDRETEDRKAQLAEVETLMAINLDIGGGT